MDGNGRLALQAFEALDIRTGTILAAGPLPHARKPAYVLTIDFGKAIGVKRSSARIADLYQPDDLAGKQIIAVVNFPPKRIAGFESEVLVLGVADGSGAVVLVAPDRRVADGERLY